MNYPVDNLDDAYNACNPDEPLLKGAADVRYLDLTAVRNGSQQNMSTLVVRIKRSQLAANYHKLLFTGHTGSGKSTELHRLKAELEQENYLVIFLDIEELLDKAEITYQDILLIIANGVVKTLADSNMALDAKFLTDLRDWFAEKVITQVYSKEEQGSVKAKVAAALKMPFVSLLTELTGEIKSASGRRTEIRQTLENELRVFIAKLNDLLIAARLKLQQQGKTDLVIIVDGLEKMTYRELPNNESSYSNLFVRHAEQLKAPQSHIIYTVPIALTSNDNLGNEFADSVFMIPMVRYKTPQGEQALIELVGKRMSLSLFESPDLLKKLIAVCGGSTRDLFRLIRSATETTAVKIQDPDVERAVRTLAKEYDRLVKKEYIALLKEVHASKRIEEDGDKSYEHLLRLRLVHEYENGENWADIHPVLLKISRVRDQIV